MDICVKNNKLFGNISAITSKSYAHRAIFCAILSKGKSKLVIDTISEDIQSTINVAKCLGCEIRLEDNILEIIPPLSFPESVILNVGESGTTLRFLIPVVAVLGIKAEIIREGSLVLRTNKVYFELFNEKNIEIYEEDKSIFINGKLENSEFKVDGNISSQFISGLLIALGFLNKESKIILNTELQSKPYVDITIDVMKKFKVKVKEENENYITGGGFVGTCYKIERDWSNALFFLIAGVKVLNLNKNSIQGDKKALDFLKALGYENISKNNYKLEKLKREESFRVIDAKDIPDAVPILSILAAITSGTTEVINIERLKFKESDRVKSSVEMLENLGVNISLKENSFLFNGVEKFNSCTINSYNDHRIAMSAAIASVFSRGEIKILNSQSVNKSYIGFFDDFKKLGGEFYVI